MMDSPIPDIVDVIQVKLVPLEQEISDTSQELDQLTSQRDALKEALSILRRGDKPRQMAATSKAAITKNELIAMISDHLQSHGPTDKLAMEEILRRTINQDAHRDLSRFTQRFKAALDSGDFMLGDDNLVSLASELST